jgi:hypothetical protein
MLSPSPFPPEVQQRIAQRITSIKPALEAINSDLGEWGLAYLCVNLGTVKVVVSSPGVSFTPPTDARTPTEVPS